MTDYDISSYDWNYEATITHFADGPAIESSWQKFWWETLERNCRTVCPEVEYGHELN